MESRRERVRFSSILVTAVETRPRTLTDDKPNLYWTSDEIKSLRLQQPGHDLMRNAGSSNRTKKSLIAEEVKGRDPLFVAPHELINLRLKRYTLRGKKDTRKRRKKHFEFGKHSSQSTNVAVEEENGPHLLSPYYNANGCSRNAVA